MQKGWGGVVAMTNRLANILYAFSVSVQGGILVLSRLIPRVDYALDMYC